jgi:glycosyltransferase involved in cell wall biosynthesis
VAELVSILIPAYNAERWIEETICSALGQTWPNKEIIIIDDGSRDNTLAAAKRYESKSVKVATQDNRGASAARNEALRCAQGDYIQWLDADDLLAPDKISTQLEKSKMNRDERVLLSSAYGTFFYRKEKAIFDPHALWQNLLPIDWLMIKFTENVWMNPAVWLISRQLIELAGPWDERLSLDDDGEYFCRVVSKSKEIRFVREAGSYYRQGNLGSLSKRTSEKACKSLLLSLSLCIGYLRALEDTDRTRSASLKYLQTWSSYFYLENAELLERIENIACDLGGTLADPSISWKYSPIERILGRKMATRVMHSWRKVKIETQRDWDRALHALSRGIPTSNRSGPQGA